MNDDIFVEIIFNFFELLYVHIILLEKLFKVFLFCIEDLIAEGTEIC